MSNIKYVNLTTFQIRTGDVSSWKELSGAETKVTGGGEAGERAPAAAKWTSRCGKTSWTCTTGWLNTHTTSILWHGSSYHIPNVSNPYKWGSVQHHSSYLFVSD